MKHATGSGGGVRSRMAKKWLPQSRWPYDLVLLVLFCGVTGSCPPGERRLLMKCLEPLHYLQENHNYPSEKACNLIINLIDCVEQRLFRCHGFVEVHDALNIAESLKAEYCNVEAPEKRSTPTTVATTVTTIIPQTTITLTTRPSVADEDDSEIDNKFQLCRDKFTKHEPKTLEEGCRLAEAFLDCGYAVLQAYKVSLDTLYLHAELLRNSAIYWEYCGDDRSSVPAIRNAKKERCQTHVIQHLKDCLVGTKHMMKGNEKPFCSLVPSYIPCIAPVVNKCSHVRQFDRVEDFLMDSLDLQRLHCLSPPPIFSEAEAGTNPLPESSESARKGHEQSGEDPLHASGFSKTENSVPLNKQHALNQLKNPSQEAAASFSSTSDFRKSRSRRKDLAPKASASELPESRDSDGDDLTRTGSGSEETGEEGLTKMQEELSSGEAKLSSSEQHEGTEPDGSLLEDDPSGSGASWQQEVKVDSATTVYRTPRQPEGLPKTSKTKQIEKHISSLKQATTEEINTDAEKLASGYSTLETKKTNIRNKKNKENLLSKKNKKVSSTTSLSVNTTRLSDNQENQTVVYYETQSKEKVGNDAKGNQPLDEESGKTHAEVSLLSPSSTTVRSNTEDKYIPETTSGTLSNITPSYTKEVGEDQNANSNNYRGEENEENVYPTETQSPLKKTKSQKKPSRTYDQPSPASYKPSTNGIQKKSEVTETTLSINNRVNEPATEQEADSHLKEETDSTSYYYENVEDAQEEEEREEANLFPNELGEWSTLQPWGSGCSKPFYGSQFCTSIMMTTQLGHRDSECRGLRSYVSCLRALMDACENFPLFETIPGTIKHIMSNYRKKCMN